MTGGPRLLLGLASAAVAFAAADTYVVVLALPDMMGSVGIPIDELQRGAPIVSGFLLGYVAMLPLIGRISDLRGRVPVLVAALLVFAVGSLVTALSYDLTTLVIGRFLQGVGGGGLIPATLALVADLYPVERRGVPLGVVSAVQEVGSVVGPLYGAVILAVSDWRVIFAVNLVVGLVLAFLIRRAAPRVPDEPTYDVSSRPGHPDRVGLALLAVTLVAGTLVFVEPGSLLTDVTWGQLFIPVAGSSRWATPLGLVTIVAAVLLVVRCWTARRPLVDLRGWWATIREADLLGAILLAVALGGVILAFATGDPRVEVFAPQGWWYLLGAAVATVVLVWHLRTEERPLVPRGAFRRTPAWGALVVSLFVGAALIAALIDIPIFARTTVYPDSQLQAALVLVRFLVALPVGAVVGGYLIRALPAGVVAAGGMLLAAARLRTHEPVGPDHAVGLVGQRLAPGRRPRLRACAGPGQRRGPRLDRQRGARARVGRRRGLPDGRDARRHLRPHHDRAAALLRRDPRRTPTQGGLRRSQPVRRVRQPAATGRHRAGAHGLRGGSGVRCDRGRARAGAVPGCPHRGATLPCVGDFDDLTAANAVYAESFADGGFDGVAHAGVAVVTCMDSRIVPLEMLGLRHGDAKIFRNPGARVTPQALEALVLGVHLLGVDRILVVPHTRCAMASATEEELHRRVSESAGVDASWQRFHVVDDQLEALADDVQRVRAHPLIPERVKVGGFVYDVDTGRLTQHV